MLNNMRRVGVLLVAVCICIAFTPMVNGSIAHGKTVKLNKQVLYMSKGKTAKLKVTGTKSKVKWSSSNGKVATVSKNGKVTAKGYGDAVITAKVGKKKLKCAVYSGADKYGAKAAELRAMILKKDSKQIKYVDKKLVDTYTYIIKADPKDTKLVFSRKLVTTDKEYGYNDDDLMTIDLIKNKEGTFKYEYSSATAEILKKGKLVRDFDKEGKGLSLTKNQVTDKTDGKTTNLALDDKEAGIEAFYQVKLLHTFNLLLTNKGDGLTMKAIGFKNC